MDISTSKPFVSKKALPEYNKGRLGQRESVPAQSHALQASGLIYRSGKQNLINGIDLSFTATGLSAIMGYNGAGKSLLLRLLHGMIKPSSGYITWNGKPVDESVRKQQSMVFQKPILLRRSVQENLCFVLRTRGADSRESLDKADELLHWVGLQELKAKPARLLSGGEQQRLSLARALATAPTVLFLDEASANLDPASTAWIEKIILDTCRNGTKVIMVTHDIGLAQRTAQEVIFIDQGTLKEQAVVEQFFKSPASAEASAFISGRLPPHIRTIR